MNRSKSAHRGDVGHPERKPPRRSRRAARKAQAEAWNLRFASAGTTVPAALVQDSPTLLVAAVEDLCWEVAAEDWRARRPRRWHRRAYDAGRAQSDWLEQKRRRLSLLIDDGLAIG